MNQKAFLMPLQWIIRSETKLPLSNNYEYDEMVNAVYTTYSGKRKNFSYQFGLRAEHSNFTGTLWTVLLNLV